MNSTRTLQDSFKNDRDKFLSRLSSYVIIDIGVIEDINAEGRARVVSSTFMDNKPIVYEDAEVIFPGNANGTFAASGRNMACLIFIPRSCMPDVGNLKLHLGASSYNKDGVKAMPIGDGVANAVKAYYSDGGSLAILTKMYNITFNEADISLQTEDGRTSLAMDGTGQLYLSRRTDEGELDVNIEDTGVTQKFISKNQDVIWTDTRNPDGSRSFVQKDNNDNVLSSVTIAADGTMAVTGKEITLNGDDKRLVTYAELDEAMQKLWTALTTTPIAGNGSTQSSWTGLPNGIDISAAETQTIKTGG